MEYRSLKGFRDLLPDDLRPWHWIESTIRSLTERYGFEEVRLPIVEATELFVRGIGEGTDMVGKEMYTFNDKSDPPVSIALRPEMTAGAARAYVEHSVGKQQNLTRWYYRGESFRYEQPQAGRFRQFYQFGVELIGSERPEAEADVIGLAYDLLRELGIREVQLLINSLGMPDERRAFRAGLVEFLKGRKDRLSSESQGRIDTNPLRVLDSKLEEDIEATADAPSILEFLGDESTAHFERVKALLDAAEIPYEVKPHLVRGIDYYTRTVFEFVGSDLGAQNTLIGGGRYDNLIEEVGGPSTPAIGFGCGLDRLVLSVLAADSMPDEESRPGVYIVALDDGARNWAAGVIARLRREGVHAEYDLLARSMKAQMRDANRRGASFAVIVGGNEMEERVAQVKNMAENEQNPVPFDELEAYLLQRSAIL